MGVLCTCQEPSGSSVSCEKTAYLRVVAPNDGSHYSQLPPTAGAVTAVHKQPYTFVAGAAGGASRRRINEKPCRRVASPTSTSAMRTMICAHSKSQCA